MSVAYNASIIVKKEKRYRRSPEEMQSLRDAMKEIIKASRPMQVRQMFYQMVVRGLVKKTENECDNTVGKQLIQMRMNGTIPFSWIVDDSGSYEVTRTFNNVEAALKHTAEFYRRSALRESDVHIEIWCEKEGLKGFLWDAASEYDVPVIVARCSLSRIYSTVMNIKAAEQPGKRSYIYQFGDWDDQGLIITQATERRIYELCDRFHVSRPHVERLALTEELIDQFNLPTRPPKSTRKTEIAVELDALPPNELRRIVREAIEQHITPQDLEVLRTAEASEREWLTNLYYDNDYDPEAS